MRVRLKPPTTTDGVDEHRTQYIYRWLLVAIFFEYVRPGQFVPGIDALKLNTLIHLGLVGVVFFANGLRSFQQIFSDRSARWLSFLLFLVLLSVPVAEVTEYSFKVFKAVLGYYLMFLVVARVATSARRIRGVFAALIAAHLFIIAMTPDILLSTGERPYLKGGPFLGDGNDFSLSLCILIPMTVALAGEARRRAGRLLAWGVLAIIVLAIVGSQSRGATLGAVAVACFLWLLSNRKLAVLAVISVAAVAVALYASDAYFKRMSSIENYQTEGSAQGRIIAWKASLRMAADHPLLGVGTGHFPVAFGAKYMPRDLGPMPWLTAHSTYFLALGELGVPGFIAILAIIAGNISATLGERRRLLLAAAGRHDRQIRSLANLLYLLTASMVGFAVAGAFLSATYYPHLFILTGLMIASRALARATPAAAAGKDVAIMHQGRASRRSPGLRSRRPRAAGKGTPAA